MDTVISNAKEELIAQGLDPVTTVVNIALEPHDVYIGRRSKWGNPFKTGRDGTKQEVIDRYRQEILPTLAPYLHELVGKRLGCHCKPDACHGDVLAEAVNLI